MQGVHFALPYLTQATRAVLDRREAQISARGKRVVVVGGGDTGNDCVATALRQGCAHVVQLEMLPAPPAERDSRNPWPEWPRTLRTDYGQQEAVFRQGQDPRQFETTVQRIVAGQSGAVRSVVTTRVRRSQDGGFEAVPGTGMVLPCDLLLIAAGFVGCDEETARHFHLSVTQRGTPRTIGTSHAVAPGLFVAGDTHTGQSLVVRAIADALATAAEVHDFFCRA